MKQAVSDENSFINRNIFELKRTDRRCNMVKPSIDGFRQNKILKNLGDEDLHVLAPTSNSSNSQFINVFLNTGVIQLTYIFLLRRSYRCYLSYWMDPQQKFPWRATKVW